METEKRISAYWCKGSKLSKKKPVGSYWWKGRANFGDALAPLLLSRFAGIESEWSEVGQSSVISIGSVLEHIPPDWSGYVLGSGRLYPDSELNWNSNINVLALRGPLSAAFLKRDCALGDPGLLADELVPVQSREYDLGILPHWSDTDLTNNLTFVGHKWSTLVINPRDNPIKVITYIGRCKKLVTSSLHGLIVADSFGIPRRFEYTPRFDAEGGLFKFFDYSTSIGANFIPGKLIRPNRNGIENRKHEIYDAYAEFGVLWRHQ